MRRVAILLTLSAVIGCSAVTTTESEDRCGTLSPMTNREVCRVPAGSYVIGCAENREEEFVEQCNSHHPLQTVESDAFYVDRREIDDASYQMCVDAGACSDLFKPSTTGLRAEDANAVCAYYGGSLLSAVQWEIAARGTDERPYPWGDDPPSCDRANYVDCGGELAPPGSSPSGQSPFGIYDMAGNFAEYALDEPYYPEIRGGSYRSTADAYMDDWDDDGIIESWPTQDGIRTYHRHVDEDIPFLGMPGVTARCAWPVR